MRIKSVSMDFFFVFGIFNGLLVGFLNAVKLANSHSTYGNSVIISDCCLSFFLSFAGSFALAIVVGLLINLTLKIIGGWKLELTDKHHSAFEETNDRIIKRNLEILKKKHKI